MGGGDASFTSFVGGTLVVSLFGAIVTVEFDYEEIAYEFTDGITCTINGLNAVVLSSSGSGGKGSASINITGTNAKFFTQGYTQVYQLTYTFEGSPTQSDTVTYYWRQAIDGNNLNLATTGNGFTAININSQNKSILLPPVASKSGYIYRLKIINYASPNLLRISPYLTGFVNTTNVIAGTAPYDSMIDGALSTIRLEGSNFSISLVSDGTNWSIISLYVSSLLTPSVATPSGSSSTETTPTQVLYYKSSSVFNVILAPMVYSFIKYVSILNQDTSSRTFNIFFPTGKSVDTVTPTGSETIKVSLTIPASSLGTITLTYTNNQYYILGYYIFGTGDNITNNTTSEAGDNLTKGISFTTTIPDSGTIMSYEIRAAELTANYSIINIVKLNNNTSYVSTVRINKPRSQGSSYFAIRNATNIKQLSISLTPAGSNYRYSCIWLAKYYDSTYDTIILPVHYYLATTTGGGISP
jgi:hypothetical protein